MESEHSISNNNGDDIAQLQKEIANLTRQLNDAVERMQRLTAERIQRLEAEAASFRSNRTVLSDSDESGPSGSGNGSINNPILNHLCIECKLPDKPIYSQGYCKTCHAKVLKRKKDDWLRRDEDQDRFVLSCLAAAEGKRLTNKPETYNVDDIFDQTEENQPHTYNLEKILEQTENNARFKRKSSFSSLDSLPQRKRRVEQSSSPNEHVESEDSSRIEISISGISELEGFKLDPKGKDKSWPMIGTIAKCRECQELLRIEAAGRCYKCNNRYHRLRRKFLNLDRVDKCVICEEFKKIMAKGQCRACYGKQYAQKRHI